MSDAPKRPRGLKRSTQASEEAADTQPPAKSARSVDDATGTGVEDVTVLREEQIALPEEVGETEDGLAEDGYQLFEAALVEIEKGALAVAQRFLEGAIHELQTLLDNAGDDPAETRLLHTLGMSWCELGILVDDVGYVDRGLLHLRNAAKDKTANPDVLWDTARMIIAKYCNIRQEEEAAGEEPSAAEDADVALATEMIDTALAQGHGDAVRAGELLLEYAQTLEEERLITLSAKCLQYFDRAIANNGDSGRAYGGKGLCLAEMGQALMAARCQQEEADERCNEALTALMRAIELTPAEVNNEAHAQYLKGVSEVYIYMGDISMGKDENEEGERYYRQAYEACQAAHVACPHIVTEELLQEVKAVLEADMDSDDEEN